MKPFPVPNLRITPLAQGRALNSGQQDEILDFLGD